MLVYELFEEDEGKKEPVELESPYDDEVEIAEGTWPIVQEKIAKLNKRAEKLKVPLIQLHIIDEYIKKVTDPDTGREENRKYYKVKVEGESPKLAGWRFIATIEHKDTGNIIRAVPGEENNQQIRDFYEADPDYCDWCKTRRHRIDTFLVQNVNGEMKQIGRNCLTNFLGGADPKAIIWYFRFRAGIGEILNDAETEAVGKGRRGQLYFEVPNILASAISGSREYGYVNTKMAQEKGMRTTAGEVRYALTARNLSEDETKYYKPYRNPTTQDVEKANEMIAWFKALPEKEREANNFMHSLNVLLNSKQVSSRDMGFIVALIPTFKRAMQTNVERKTKTNEWIGTPNQKIPPTQITVVGTQDISGAYGAIQLVRMEDNDGRLLIWWNSSSSNMEQGKKYSIVGTIKKHDDYQGRKQTVLTRVKATPI